MIIQVTQEFSSLRSTEEMAFCWSGNHEHLMVPEHGEWTYLESIRSRFGKTSVEGFILADGPQRGFVQMAG